MTRAAERIGVFGGTFDPPHVGHVSVARDVADALELDRLLWIPARHSPLKPDAPATPDHVRVRMVQAAAAVDPRFQVDTRELRRPPPSYTVDTLEELRAEVGPEAELFLVMGVDQYDAFDAWHEPDRIRRLATLTVMDRDGTGTSHVEGAVVVPVRRVDVSATEIRRRVREGVALAGLVPEGVAQIVEEEGLYA
jgi:nicotinate-nucleotide adenylyltransferase